MPRSVNEAASPQESDELRLFRFNAIVRTSDGVLHQLGDIVPLTQAQFRELRTAQAVDGKWEDAEIAPPPTLPERRLVRVTAGINREGVYRIGELISVTLKEFTEFRACDSVEGTWDDAAPV